MVKLDQRSSLIARSVIMDELARTKAAKGELAAAMGIEPSALSKVIAGTRQVDINELAKAFRFFGSDVETMQKTLYSIFPGMEEKFVIKGLQPQGAQAPPIDESLVSDLAEVALKSPEKTSRDQRLVILRTEEGPDTKTFRIYDEIIDAKPRPSSLAPTRRVEAIYMFGASARPRYLDGEIVIFDLDRQAAVGEYVLVQEKPESSGARTCRIGKMIQRTNKDVEIESPDGSIKAVPLKEIDAIRRILPTSDLMG